MVFFMITWWDASQGHYHDEYFRKPCAMFARFTSIYENIPLANPEIHTLHTED